MGNVVSSKKTTGFSKKFFVGLPQRNAYTKFQRDLLFFSLFAILLMVLPSTASAGWTIETIEIEKYFYNGDVAIEKTTNYPHIVYGGDKLYHAYFDGTQWNREILDPSPYVESSSIAIDSNNKVHISYTSNYGAGGYPLKYATNVSGEWVISTVDESGYLNNSSIAIDSDNKVHISYLDLTFYDSNYDDLKYATNASGSWVTTTVDSTAGKWTYTSIAVDSNGKAHITYISSLARLTYATNASGEWVISTVDNGGSVSGFSIAIDSNNKAHISYSSWNVNYVLKYATNASGEWVTSTLDSGADLTGNSSIAIDSNGKVHISYVNFYYNPDFQLLPQFKYLTNASGEWVISTFDDSNLPYDDMLQYTSFYFIPLAIDSNNKVHISYFDGDCSLKYATNVSGEWVFSTVDNGGFGSALSGGMPPSMAIDSNGKAHITYISSLARLTYVTNVSGEWVFSMLRPFVWSGSSTSIAIDSNDKVHISFENPYWEEKYVTNASGEWVFSTVTNDFLSNSSLAIDSNNKVHISYSSGDALKYATNASGEWVISIVDGSESFGSIAIDSDNKVHISYSSGDALKYATNASGEWVISTVDGSMSYYIRYPSLAIDSNNKAHISFSYVRYDYQTYQIWNAVFKYATNASGEWVISIVDNVTVDNVSGNFGNFSGHSSLAIDSNNKAHISYSSWNVNYVLKYAANASGEWVISTVDNGGQYSRLVIDTSNNEYICYPGSLKYAANAAPLVVDNDNDGYTSDVDCNDNDPSVNPGATEVVNNGKDDDCNSATPVNTASGSGYNYPVPSFRASLSLNVNATSLGTSYLKYYYTKNRLSLVSTSITGITSSGGTATVTGVGTVNNIAGCSFTATVTDGSPDAMGIVITPGGSCTTSSSASSQTVSSGSYSVVGE